MWDLIGKITEQPVHKILEVGGTSAKSGRMHLLVQKDMLDKASCAEFAALMKGQGWTACKTNILRDQEWNKLDNRRLSNLEADRNAQGFANMREALGLGFDIAVHCHWEFDFDSALRLANAVAPVRPIWMDKIHCLSPTTNNGSSLRRNRLSLC